MAHDEVSFVLLNATPAGLDEAGAIFRGERQAPSQEAEEAGGPLLVVGDTSPAAGPAVKFAHPPVDEFAHTMLWRSPASRWRAGGANEGAATAPGWTLLGLVEVAVEVVRGAELADKAAKLHEMTGEGQQAKKAAAEQEAQRAAAAAVGGAAAEAKEGAAAADAKDGGGAAEKEGGAGGSEDKEEQERGAAAEGAGGSQDGDQAKGEEEDEEGEGGANEDDTKATKQQKTKKTKKKASQAAPHSIIGRVAGLPAGAEVTVHLRAGTTVYCDGIDVVLYKGRESHRLQEDGAFAFGATIDEVLTSSALSVFYLLTTHSFTRVPLH